MGGDPNATFTGTPAAQEENFLDGPAFSDTPAFAFNPLNPPFDPVKESRERMIENIAVLDLGLDASPEQYAEYQEKFKDVPLGALEESYFNRERVAALVPAPDGGYMIDYRQPVGQRMKMLDLSPEDIAAIGSQMGLESESITLFNLERKQEEVLAQQRLLNEYQAEMEKLKMTDLPAYKEIYKQQEDLLNKLVDEYEALYNTLGEE